MDSESPVEFLNYKKQVCGVFKKGIYRKKVDSRKHKLRIMDAYGIDEMIVNKLIELGCSEIRIKEMDTGRVLSTSIDNFLEHSVVRNFDTEQRFLSVKYFV